MFQKLPTSQHWWVCIFLAHSVAKHIYNEFLRTLSLSGKVKITADSMICHTTYSWTKGRFPPPPHFLLKYFKTSAFPTRTEKYQRLAKQETMVHDWEIVYEYFYTILNLLSMERQQQINCPHVHLIKRIFLNKLTLLLWLQIGVINHLPLHYLNIIQVNFFFYSQKTVVHRIVHLFPNNSSLPL